MTHVNDRKYENDGFPVCTDGMPKRGETEGHGSREMGARGPQGHIPREGDGHGPHGQGPCRRDGHGPFGHGPGEMNERGPHGPGPRAMAGHGPRGRDGNGMPRHDPPRLPRPRGRITESGRYQADDVNGKLQAMLWALEHASRAVTERGGQGRVLSILKAEGEMTQRELTERLGIQPGSASEIISKLERAGFLVRTPSLSDRRTADISLTEAGAARAAEAAARAQSRREEMFSALTEEEKRQLLTLMEKVYVSWEGQREARR